MSEAVVYFGVPYTDVWVDYPERFVKVRDKVIFGDYEASDLLNKCPAYLNVHRNMFVITYPFNYAYRWTDYGIVSNLYNQEFFENMLLMRDPANGYSSLEKPKLYFFSEEDMEMEVLKAYHHDNDFVNKASFVEGSFNISKHFRPLEYPHKFKQKNTEITLNRGDAIAYVKFKTNKKVVLKQFNVTQEMLNMSKKIISLRNYSSNVKLFAKPLEFYYDLFEKHKLKNYYLRLIKNNLVE